MPMSVSVSQSQSTCFVFFQLLSVSGMLSQRRSESPAQDGSILAARGHCGSS